jgi:hypothetical protein
VRRPILKFENWLLEKVEYHQELNPKVWEGDQMRPEIRAKLLAIANDFWSSLKLNAQVVDIELTGSLANYNWTKYSDLDVHVIIDFAQVDKNVGLVRSALDGMRFVWNQRHPVTIEGYDVECYVQDKNEQHTSSGLFSILNNSWITVPSYNPPQVDERDVREKVRVFKSELKEVRSRLKTAKGEKAKELFDYLKRLKKKISEERKEGLSRGGEFSVENVVFKTLRNDGTIERIIDTMGEAYAKIYVD